MASKEIQGLDKLLLKMKGVSEDMIKRVTKAVDTTAIRIANHAKAGHTPGQGHGMGRYENRTTNLTNSIIPTMTHVGADFIEAVVKPTDNPALTASVSAIMEYGPKVEVAYPFMLPAEESQREAFKTRLKAAIRGVQ